MLRIYPVLLELVRFVGPLVRELERRDPDLARQCRRALSSAPLNVAEGSYSRGRNRAARYHTALGSLREVLACFEWPRHSAIYRTSSRGSEVASITCLELSFDLLAVIDDPSQKPIATATR